VSSKRSLASLAKALAGHREADEVGRSNPTVLAASPGSFCVTTLRSI